MPTKKTAKKAPVKKAVAKKTAPEKVAAKKPPAKKAVKKAAVKESKAVNPTPDAIAKAAYLNYRKRVELGLPGDNQSDWVEAERSLREG